MDETSAISERISCSLSLSLFPKTETPSLACSDFVVCSLLLLVAESPPTHHLPSPRSCEALSLSLLPSFLWTPVPLSFSYGPLFPFTAAFHLHISSLHLANNPVYPLTLQCQSLSLSLSPLRPPPSAWQPATAACIRTSACESPVRLEPYLSIG